MTLSLSPADGTRPGGRVLAEFTSSLGSAKRADELSLAIEEWMVVRSAALFATLSQDDVDALVARIEVARVRRGQFLFQQGDPGTHLHVVIRGRVKLARRYEDGREALVAVMGPGEQFGELSVFDPGPRTAGAQAVTDCVVAEVAAEDVRAWAGSRPHVGMQLLRVVSRRLRRTNTEMSDLIFVDVPGRLAKQLLDLGRRFGTTTSDGLRVDHGLTQEELAQMLGSSRETVNKALSNFAARGWIRVENRQIVIREPERLARRAKTALQGRHTTF